MSEWCPSTVCKVSRSTRRPVPSSSRLCWLTAPGLCSVWRGHVVGESLPLLVHKGLRGSSQGLHWLFGLESPELRSYSFRRCRETCLVTDLWLTPFSGFYDPPSAVVPRGRSRWNVERGIVGGRWLGVSVGSQWWGVSVEVLSRPHLGLYGHEFKCKGLPSNFYLH